MQLGQRGRRGFSLIELMMVIVLGTIALALGFSGLNKARTSGSSRGLATAVASELRLAREKAIVKGSPVAVVLPRGVGQSLFFLEGDTDPVVTRSVNYSGDYSRGTMAVVSYPGPSFTKNAQMLGAKSDLWRDRLNDWLPEAYRSDFVLMFTPNGSVVSNDLPAADGSYRLVVATGMTVSATGAPGGSDYVSGNEDIYFQLQAAVEPFTLAISQSGGVESHGGVLGQSGSISTSLGGAANAAAPPPVQLTYTPQVPTIFHSKVTPPAEEVDGQMVHILDKGEYLTLEVFAHSNDGKPLYTAWQDQPVTKSGDASFRGRFSVPNGAPERMEFYPEFDVNGNGTIELEERNVWRSTWTWTPPSKAEPGDRYRLDVDVKDATLSLLAERPEFKPVDVTPPGEIIFERHFEGKWHLFTMWADGSRLTRITNGAHDYRYASATADGKTIAYELNGHEVYVMNPDGTNQTKVADGRCPTISPLGNCIAYLDNASSQVYVKRLGDGAGAVSPPLATTVTTLKDQPVVPGDPPIGNRMAFSPDGRWLYYTAGDSGGNRIKAVRLNMAGPSVTFSGSQEGYPAPNCDSIPYVSGLCAGEKGEVFYHADANDPFVGMYELNAAGIMQEPDMGAPPAHDNHNVRYSPGVNEMYPAISPNQDLLLFCRKVGSDFQICRVPKANWRDYGQAVVIRADGQNIRPAWIRQSSTF